MTLPDETTAPKAEHLYGAELLEKLRYGWAPLPTKTLFTLVLGGLKIRMMRSLVTMLSIVLAIAFLTYTGLSGRLYFNLAKVSVQMGEYAPIDPKLPAEAAAALAAFNPVLKMAFAAKVDLARRMEMDDVRKQETELTGLTGPLIQAKADSEKAKKDLKAVEEDAKATPQDLVKARKDAESTRVHLSTLETRKAALEEQTALGRWLRGGAMQDAEMAQRLSAALAVRCQALLETAGTPGRLSEDGLEQLELLVKTASGFKEAAAYAETLSTALDQERVKRKASELRTMLVRAGVDVQKTLSGSALNTWLIIMALLTCTVGIANAMLMSVTERFREIGTMKCLGALDALVVKLFLLESAMLGTVGALIGILLGAIVALAAGVLQFRGYGILHFPLAGMAVVFVESMAAGLLLAVIGAVYPALVAAGMKPVDALRIEE